MMNRKTEFRIGLSKYAPCKYYWNEDTVNNWRNGYLNLNGFVAEGFDESHYFAGKVHSIASWIVNFINASRLDNLPIVSKRDIEADLLWKSFKRIVAKVMKKRKIGRGIRIGSPSESWVGGYWPDKVSPKTELGKMIDSGELLEVNTYSTVETSTSDDIFDNSGIKKTDPVKLNEKFIEEVLTKQKYTVMTVKQNW